MSPERGGWSCSCSCIHRLHSERSWRRTRSIHRNLLRVRERRRNPGIQVGPVSPRPRIEVRSEAPFLVRRWRRSSSWGRRGRSLSVSNSWRGRCWRTSTSHRGGGSSSTPSISPAPGGAKTSGIDGSRGSWSRGRGVRSTTWVREPEGPLMTLSASPRVREAVYLMILSARPRVREAVLILSARPRVREAVLILSARPRVREAVGVTTFVCGETFVSLSWRIIAGPPWRTMLWRIAGPPWRTMHFFF